MPIFNIDCFEFLEWNKFDEKSEWFYDIIRFVEKECIDKCQNVTV